MHIFLPFDYSITSLFEIYFETNLQSNQESSKNFRSLFPLRLRYLNHQFNELIKEPLIQLYISRDAYS